MTQQKASKRKVTRSHTRRILSPEQEDILRHDEEQGMSLLVRGLPISLPLLRAVVRYYIERLRKKRPGGS